MKTIPVTGGYEAQVDDEDYEYLSQFNWCFVRPKDGKGRTNTVYTQRFVSKAKYLSMHRELMGSPAGKYVDHIDGNGLNNCRGNLRLCNQSQNGGNSRKVRLSSSRFKGVSFSKKRGEWMSYICPKRSYIHLGYFVEEIEAAKAYNKAAVEHFGEFARINEIEPQLTR